MEPLIAISDAARARIRAKEAEADQRHQSVRRALEGDVARANRTWGGYFDLHQDSLHEALSEAREGADELDRLCAQLVYVAHASEYRTVVPEPKALEPVLASLREAVIKQYGEHTRAAVQSLEAQQMVVAWDDQSPPQASELEAQHLTPDPTAGIGRPEEAQFDNATTAKQSRASTVAKLIKELDILKPQMFEDEAEYKDLQARYPTFLTFKIAATRRDLELKVLSIRSSPRHIRLAQELAAAHHGRQLSTIQDDWKDHKPAEFKRPK